MKKKTFITMAVAAVLVIASGGAKASDFSRDIVTVKPVVGAFLPHGNGLDDVTPMGGIQVDWEIDDTFGLRLGLEYAESDVSDGSVLKLARFPILVTTPPSKRPWPFRNFYVGFGGVATIAHYDDGHYGDINKLGPALLVGYKISKHFNAELGYDSMKKSNRNYGGYSMTLTYGGY